MRRVDDNLKLTAAHVKRASMSNGSPEKRDGERTSSRTEEGTVISYVKMKNFSHSGVIPSQSDSCVEFVLDLVKDT